MTDTAPPTIILASGSKTRAEMLARAGITPTISPARVDEDALKEGLRAEGANGGELAVSLAEAKAMQQARHHPGALVIGADQVLECEGNSYDKPSDRDAAADQLAALSGRMHEQISAACVVRDGAVIWHHVDRAKLHMRTLSPDFITYYLDQVGAHALGAPGAYQIEGLGAQLFRRVEGDYFTILGLPLLPLLDFLRAHRVIGT